MTLSKLMWERYWILAKVINSHSSLSVCLSLSISRSHLMMIIFCGVSGASLSVSRPTNAAGMPTEGEDIVTQEQFFAFIEQEIRKIDLFTKRMVSHHYRHYILVPHTLHHTLHRTYYFYPLPTHNTLLHRANTIKRIMHPITLPLITKCTYTEHPHQCMSYAGTRHT